MYCGRTRTCRCCATHWPGTQVANDVTAPCRRRRRRPERRADTMLMQRVLTALVRSEEHTSELQSLMRISYAVFCLKKKTDQTMNTNRSTRHKQPTHIHNT